MDKSEKSFPQRKNPRLQGYDYLLEGMYFVTICTYLRVHHFGHIENQEMRLNNVGKIAASCWLEIPAHYPNVELDEFVVMPNHVHGIIVIIEANHSTNPMDKTADGMYPVPTNKRVTLGTIVGTYKAAVTRAVNQSFPVAEKIWQTRYHDHIIRSESALNHIRQYVHHNPALWEKDTFYG